MGRRTVALWMASAALVAIGGYVAVVRPWTKRWGATDDEVARAMPGDNVVARADNIAPRAMTIHDGIRRRGL